MGRKRRVAAALLCAGLVLGAPGLTACGPGGPGFNGDQNDDSPENAPGQEQEPTPVAPSS